MSLIGDISGLGAAASAVSGIVTAVTGVIDKVVPDPDLKAKLSNQVELAVIGQSTELTKVMLEGQQAQINVNTAEAQSGSLFVSGWRPFIGWVCGGGFTYAFIAQPLLSWVASWFGGAPLPSLDMGTLLSVLGGILGLGGLRTYEKIQGVERSNMDAPSPSVLKRMFK